MKRIIPILLIALICVACNKPVANKEQDLSHADSLLLNVFRAIGDSTYSCLDCKDAFYELLDTMQTHVEFYPDESVRVGAKSLALEIVGLCVYGDFLSPEEQQFFYDSLVLRFADVMATWYSPLYASERDSDWRTDPVLSQCVVFHDNDTSNTNQSISLDMYITPDNEDVMIITLPVRAEYLASVMFHGEDMRDIDTTTTFNLMNAYNVLDKTEDYGQVIVFGEGFIDTMLTHDGMYIAYIGDEDSDDIKERFHDAHLPLTKFHEQYRQVKELLNR